MAVGLRTPHQARPNLAFPVAMKEMRSRMRGNRIPTLLFVCTGLLILVGLLIIGPQWNDVAGANAYAFQGHLTRMGRTLFAGILILEAILCPLIAPALTAGAISVEREQQSLELLLLTRLTESNILLGKLASSLGLIGIILLCALPVGAISFVLGGVAPAQLLWGLALIGAVVIFFGSVGLYCSCRFQRTATAVAVAYTIAMAWLGLLPVGGWLLDRFNSITSADGVILILCLFIAIMLLLAVAPASIISVLLTLIRRHRMPRVVNLALWGGCAALICLLLNLPGALDCLDPGALFVANPLVAMLIVLGGAEAAPGIMYEQFYGSTSIPWDAIFVPLTILLQLLSAWVVVTLAVRELRRLRE